MHKLLHLQHHSHTAKHLPHHHTSYRALLLVVVLLGTLMVWLNSASAVDYDVSAVVPAPLPAGSPAITGPPAETVFSATSQVTVSGDCIVIIPALVVVLERGGDPVGSAVCQADGSFRIPISLITGTNNISAKYKTITGETGPNSPTTVYFYQPPAAPAATGGTSPGAAPAAIPNPSAEPLIIKTVDFVPYALEEKLLMSAEIRGGTPPYMLKVDWGDGTVETFTVQAMGSQQLSHVYKVSKASMMVIFEASDSAGQKTQVHIAAVYKAGRPMITASPTVTDTKPSVFEGWASTGILAGYGGIVLFVGFVWLHARHRTPSRAAYFKAPSRRAGARKRRA